MSSLNLLAAKSPCVASAPWYASRPCSSFSVSLNHSFKVKFSQVAGKGSDNPHVPGQKGRFAVVAAKTKDYDVSLVFRACGSADEINSKILDGEGFPAFHHGD